MHSVHESKRVGYASSKVRQQVLGTLVRFDELKASGRLEAALRRKLLEKGRGYDMRALP